MAWSVSIMISATGRPACAEAVPRRSLPVDGRRGGGAPGARPVRSGVGRHDPGWQPDHRSGVLSGTMLLRTIGDAGRAANWPPQSGGNRRHRPEGREAMTRFFVPRDAAARAVGADGVAAALQHEAERRGLAIELVRTGSRGLFWLEPMIEVETVAGRIAYGPVTPA